MQSLSNNIFPSISNKEMDIIKNNPLKQNYRNLACTYVLSEDFINEYKQYFDDYAWMYISKYQELSESFIEQHKDNVWWYQISGYQCLSIDFINKFYNKIDFNQLKYNQKISDQVKELCKMFI